MARLVEISYKPRSWAKELHKASTRWIWVCIHRRGGKTTAILNHLQRDATKTPKSQWAFVGPTYKQTKRIAWEILKEISAPIPGIAKNEVELSVTYPNGSKIFLAGAENIDSLRGIPLWGGASDEDAWQNPMLFTSVISKCLADHLGYWIFAGTPLGKNHFFRRGEIANKDPEWTYIFHTIDDSLEHEDGETIQNLRQALIDDRKLIESGEMTQEEYEQEWYCSFDAAIRGAYYAREISQLRKDGRLKVVPWDKELPVHTVCDLGVGPAFAVGFYQRTGNEMRMIDYWEGTESEGMPEFVAMLKSKPYVYGRHFAPHDIRATEMGTGKTRLDTAKKLGIDFRVVPRMGVDDGIARGRLMMGRLWIDENKCAQWIDKVSQYRQRWDDNRKMFIEEPLHDFTSHAADVHRYASVIEHEMVSDMRTRSFRQGGYESSMPYADDVAPTRKEESMRPPPEWNIKTPRYQQPGFESSLPIGDTI